MGKAHITKIWQLFLLLFSCAKIDFLAKFIINLDKKMHFNTHTKSTPNVMLSSYVLQFSRWISTKIEKKILYYIDLYVFKRFKQIPSIYSLTVIAIKSIFGNLESIRYF